MQDQNAVPWAAKSGEERHKASCANLIRCSSSGIYYAGLRAKGKLIGVRIGGKLNSEVKSARPVGVTL